MKKNNKGFTLIELLAAIVIMGILVLFAAPVIVNVVSNNRNRMYITDAKKLLSQVEYKVKASSSVIQKPAPGDAIIVSLMYLDTDEFDIAPNRGQYVEDASYVIVKNNEGKLEYRVSLIEEMPSEKDSVYRGIELVKTEELTPGNAAALVKSIDERNLKRVTLSETAYANYLNKKLETGYVNKISKIYNRPDLTDQASKGGTEAPVINKINVISTSGRNINTLDATLIVSATDRDTPTDDLRVYVGLNNPPSTSGAGMKYGEENLFTKQYNFKDEGVSYKNGGTVNVYVIVKDPDGNFAEKKFEYKIHVNLPPNILDESTITKLTGDSKNLTTGLLILKVEDDVDGYDDLMVCYTTDINATSCSNYKKYNDEFKSNQKNYTFETNTCALNGQTKSLKVFVKDSMDESVSKVFNYTIHKNEPPTLLDGDVEISSEAEPFTQTQSKRISVKVKGSDDVTKDSKLKVRIESAGSTTKEYNYDPTAQMPFELSGDYDGSKKNITVTLIDECGKSTSVTKQYTLYTNQAPTIENLNLVSTDYACNNPVLCPMDTGNGNFKARVNFDVNDDLDYDNLKSKISICISENSTACNSASNYKKYSTYPNEIEYNFAASANNQYNGSTKTLYVGAKDLNGKMTVTSATYKLYTNKAPIINAINIEPRDNEFTVTGTLDTTIYLDIEDDFDEMKNLRYKLTDGTKVQEGNLSKYYDTGMEEKGIDFEFSGEYDGEDRNLVLTVYDSYGVSSTKSITYETYKNEIPEISEIEVSQATSECPTNYKCPYLENGSAGVEDLGSGTDVVVDFQVTDDVEGSIEITPVEQTEGSSEEPVSDIIDKYPNILVCVSDNRTYCNDSNKYVTYESYMNSTKILKLTSANSNNPYDGSTKTIYINAKDTMGGIATETYQYKVYKNNAPTIPEGENPKISTTSTNGMNISKAKFEIEAEDDIDNNVNLKVNICYKQDGSNEEKCFGEKDYQPSYLIDFNETNYSGQKYNVYAKIKDSFGAVSTSKQVEYKLYEDKVPEIMSVEAYIEGGEALTATSPDEDSTETILLSNKCYHDVENNIYYDDAANQTTEQEFNTKCTPYVTTASANTGTDKLKVSFIVNDPYDTYKVCVSRNPNNCTNYVGKSNGEGFDGTSLNSGMLYFAIPGVIQYFSDTGVSADKYYLFVKDSKGKTGIGIIPTEDENSSPEGYFAFQGMKHKECDIIEVNPEKADYTLTEGQEISAQSCSGRCYYATSADEQTQLTSLGDKLDPSEKIYNTSGIYAKYKRTLYYKDRFNDKSCLNSKDVEETIDADCSFKSCFYNPNKRSYATRSIGLDKKIMPRNETVTNQDGNGSVYESRYYYTIYIASYDNVSATVVQNPTEYKVTPEAYNNTNLYKYDKNITDYYVRIRD